MESLVNASLYTPLDGDLAAAALEPAPDGTSITEEVAQRVFDWEKRNLEVDNRLVHLWAATDRSEALKAAISRQLENEVGEISLEDGVGMAPLDHALKNSSTGVAEYLWKAALNPRCLSCWSSVPQESKRC